MPKYLYQLIAARVPAAQGAFPNIEQSFSDRNADEIETLCREFMPSGSGFDAGTHIELDDCRARRLVFNTSFHHMNDTGSYDGWTNHLVIVEPEFHGFTIRVTGRNRNDIKDYIADAFHHALNQVIEPEWDATAKQFSFRLAVPEPVPTEPEKLASPSTVWIVTGEHFSVAGLILHTFDNEAAANNCAVHLVNLMLSDTAASVKPEPATVDTWQMVVEWLQEYHGAAHCFVEVRSEEVIS